MISDDIKIVNFLVDSGKSGLLKAMDRGTDIGTAIVFDDDDKKENMIFILRIRGHEDEEQNGIYAFALLEAKTNRIGKDKLKHLLKEGRVGNSADLNKVSDMIDSAVAIAVSTV
jgi:hypothetical protein